VNRDFNLGRETRQRFVHRVVDNFIHQMVQPRSPVDPMYIAGRLRTASIPPSTLIESAL